MLKNMGQWWTWEEHHGEEEEEEEGAQHWRFSFITLNAVGGADFKASFSSPSYTDRRT